MDGILPQQNGIATFLAYLEQQRDEYRYTLPARLASIDAIWRAICEKGPSDARMLELERYAHSIAGTGATFSFRTLSEAAKKLEIAVQQKRERARGLNLVEELRLAYAIHDVHMAAA